jgi:succinyl-diaminopimelate desuccinylase
MDLKHAFALVDDREEELVSLVRGVIGIDNCVPPGRNYEQLADYLIPYFQSAGLTTEKVVIPEPLWRQIPTPGLDGDRVNLVARKETGKEPVTIYAHIDTVPVDNRWTTDPFGGEIKDGKIYGRGTSDMKGAAASLIIALQVIKDLGLEMKFDPICCLCTDEEIGVYPGVYHLAKEGYLHGHVVCMDGSQDPREPLASAGSVDVYITTVGRSCHSGQNFLGVNALEAMVPIMAELLALKKVVEIRESAVDGPPLPGAPSTKLTPMFNLDVIRAGTKSNIVPGECTLIVNRRYLPEENFAAVMSEIEAAVERGKAKSNALAVEIKVQHSYPAVRYNPETEHAKKMKAAKMLVQGYRDDEFQRSGSAGSTDMSFVQQVLGTDDIVFSGGSRSGNNVHGVDEFAYIRDLKALAKELIYYLCF